MLLRLYLHSLEDLAPPLVARRGDEGLEDVAAGRVGGQSEEVSGAQSAQAAEEVRALLEPGQSLDQAGAMVTDGGQRHLGSDGEKQLTLLHLGGFDWPPLSCLLTSVAVLPSAVSQL